MKISITTLIILGLVLTIEAIPQGRRGGGGRRGDGGRRGGGGRRGESSEEAGGRCGPGGPGGRK